MSMKALIIFAKNEAYGKVKTRLAATVGRDKALHAYQQLLSYTASVTEALTMDKFVFYAAYIPSDDVWNKDVFQKKIQKGDDLGARMSQAFDFVFEIGYEEVVLIGTDNPELTSNHINAAFEALKDHELTLGPAVDGGYYLIGMRKSNPSLFEHISWSTNQVLMQTLHQAVNSSLTFFLLPTLQDVDEAADLIPLQNKLSTYPPAQRAVLAGLLNALS